MYFHYSRKNMEYQDLIPTLIGAYKNFCDVPDILEGRVKTITFQVTEDCNLCCTYCYQINKAKNSMTFETAKAFVDLLIEDSYKDNTYVSLTDTVGIIVEFIGGEPLLEIDLIDKIVDYFRNKLILLKHPWCQYFRVSMISNGVLYFSENVQRFLEKNKNIISFGISLDGCKELHDACRVFSDGRGSYEIAVEGCIHYMKTFDENMATKMTFAPENIEYAYDAIVNLISLGYKIIHCNPIYEDKWTSEHPKIYYRQMKKIADYLLDNDLYSEVFVRLFEDNICSPVDLKHNNRNYCGSTGSMLALDYKGDIYPCVRFMKSSLGSDREPFKIGDIYNGINVTKPDRERVNLLDSITLTSQSDNECINCPIGQGCGWCFPKGTLIKTPYGYKDISELRINDEVIDAFGNTQKVINNFKHETDNLVYVKASGIIETLTTKEHPYYTKRLIKKDPHKGYYYNEKPEWIPAGELKIGDKIGIHVDKPGVNELPLDICYIIGRYLGDGWKSVSNRKQHPFRYYICCSYDERDEFKTVLENSGITFSEFKNKTVYEYKIGISSPYNLTDILDQCGRYAHDKKVPIFIKSLTKECIEQVLRGYFDADGYLESRKNIQRFTTVSKELLLGISDLVRMVYHKNVGISIRKACDVNSTIEGRQVTVRDSYEGRFMITEPTRKYYEFDEENDIMWVNVGRSYSKVPEVETVYNLTVENTESYIANEAMVHNCTALNYQVTGTPNKRIKSICGMHKARALANVYYWNKVYKKGNYDNEPFPMNIPKEWALEIIDEEEYNMLLSLTKKED